MDSLNAREQYEETELLNEAEEENAEVAERIVKCCGSSSSAPRRAPRTHQISESKSVRVEPSVICQVTDDVYAFRDDSSTERLCKVCLINQSSSEKIFFARSIVLFNPPVQVITSAPHLPEEASS